LEDEGGSHAPPFFCALAGVVARRTRVAVKHQAVNARFLSASTQPFPKPRDRLSGPGYPSPNALMLQV
jgi:hypothetical protein